MREIVGGEAMTDPLDIEASRSICDAATPGPWGFLNSGEWLDAIIRAEDDMVCTDATDADREFIAFARTALPQALDELETVRAALDQSLAREGVWVAERDALQARIAAATPDFFAQLIRTSHLFDGVSAGEAGEYLAAALEGTVTDAP